MKKIFIGVILLSLFINLGVYASDYSVNQQIDDAIEDVTSYITDDNAAISRSDCITTIMKIIGLDKDTADRYGRAGYDQPVFLDVGIAETGANTGYIYMAKFSGIAIGVSSNDRYITNFEPHRNVTIKECLTYMLRCLKDQKTIEWDNIVDDAEEIGLLNKEEVISLNFNEDLSGDYFKKLLSRMFNMNRYLYWPIEEPNNGYSKEEKIDQTNSMSYIDWFLELKNEQVN